MSKYTAEQVEETVNVLCEGKVEPGCYDTEAADMLHAFAALLRERESAKATVTDEDLEAIKACCKEHLEVANHYLTGPYLNAGEVHKKHIGFHLALSHAIAALEAFAPMLAIVRVPDAVSDAHAPALATELARVAWAIGWNTCREAMLASAPKPEASERHHWLCCGALNHDHSDKPRVMPDCFDPERHVWVVSPKPETEE